MQLISKASSMLASRLSNIQPPAPYISFLSMVGYHLTSLFSSGIEEEASEEEAKVPSTSNRRLLLHRVIQFRTGMVETVAA